MPWNGSGVFNRIYSWVADKNGGLDIIASRMDTDTDDIASAGFGNCVTRDGQGQPNASLIPLVSATYDLGNASFLWRNGWFSGNVSATGNLSAGGTLSATGNATLGGTLAVTGNATLSAAAAVHTAIGGITGSDTFAVLSGAGAAPAISGYNNASTGEAFRARVDNTNSPLMNLFFSTNNVGSISTTTTNAAYNTSSDARLKKNIQDADLAAAIAVVRALRVRSWDWIVNDSHEAFGFVAQEEHQVAPFAVTAGDDNPDIIQTQWQRDDSKLVPALLLVIQDMDARLAALEALERA